MHCSPCGANGRCGSKGGERFETLSRLGDRSLSSEGGTAMLNCCSDSSRTANIVAQMADRVTG